MNTPGCTLHIVLDDVPPGVEYPAFYAGAVVSGTVIVRVQQPIKYHILALELAWWCDDVERGREWGEPVVSVRLYEGGWDPGEYTYRFWFICPSAPLSYFCKHATLGWHLIARIDNDWSELLLLKYTPPARRPLHIVAAPGATMDITGGDHILYPNHDRIRSAVRFLWLTIAVLPTMALAVLLALSVLNYHPTPWPVSWSRSIVLACIAWTAVHCFLALNLQAVAPRALNFEALCCRAERTSYDSIAIESEIDALREITGLSVGLAADEHVVIVIGTDDNGGDVCRHESTRLFWRGQEVAVDGKWASGRVELQVPDPSTFQGWSLDTYKLTVQWTAVVCFRLRGGGYHEHAVVIDVNPVMPTPNQEGRRDATHQRNQ